MSSAGFDLVIAAIERPQTEALLRTATGIALTEGIRTAAYSTSPLDGSGQLHARRTFDVRPNALNRSGCFPDDSKYFPKAASKTESAVAHPVT
jgi:hypothetical protein